MATRWDPIRRRPRSTRSTKQPLRRPPCRPEPRPPRPRCAAVAAPDARGRWPDRCSLLSPAVQPACWHRPPRGAHNPSMTPPPIPILRRGQLGTRCCRYCSQWTLRSSPLRTRRRRALAGRPRRSPVQLAVRPVGPPGGRTVVQLVESGATGAGRQRSYQLLVAGDEVKLRRDEGDAWDSGRRGGGPPVECSTRGPARADGPLLLEGAGRTDAGPSAWSEVATFELGLGGTEAWTASWISWDEHAVAFEPATEAGPVDQIGLGLSPVTHLRHEFDVGDDLAFARLYITARGLYEARPNGGRVGDRVLAPGWTDYAIRIPLPGLRHHADARPRPQRHRCPARRRMVLRGIRLRPQAEGRPLLGDRPELLAELRLHYRDGRARLVVTDPNWRGQLGGDPAFGSPDGGVRCSGLDPVGWDQAGFDARGWHRVVARSRDGDSHRR